MNSLKTLALALSAVPVLTLAVRTLEAQCARCISGACQWGPLMPPAYADCKIIGGQCFNSEATCGDQEFAFANVEFALDGTGMLNSSGSEAKPDRAKSGRNVYLHCSGIVVRAA